MKQTLLIVLFTATVVLLAGCSDDGGSSPVPIDSNLFGTWGTEDEAAGTGFAIKFETPNSYTAYSFAGFCEALRGGTARTENNTLWVTRLTGQVTDPSCFSPPPTARGIEGDPMTYTALPGVSLTLIADGETLALVPFAVIWSQLPVGPTVDYLARHE